jgi:adenylate cyclase class IV
MASAEQYEIEIKTLLGDEDAAEAFRSALKDAHPSVELSSTESQLNHYFAGGDLNVLAERMLPRLAPELQEKLMRIVSDASSSSVRTRESNGEVRFVVKASLGDDTSANGVIRAEFDTAMEGMTLDELDQEILDAGYSYQAKWSRDREVYELPDVTVCLDKNAGYGYLAEFEKVIDDASRAEETRAELAAFMERLGVEELPQSRLERMFAHYNQHWPDYYGTDKVFVIT